MSATDILAVQHAEAILQWYIENGVDEALSSTPVDRLAAKPVPASQPVAVVQSSISAQVPPMGGQVSGTPEAKADAVRILADVKTLDELRLAIQSYEGLAIKKTAMNMVFSSGNTSAPIMVIGDAPEAEDDRAGVPFSGEVGQLADKMFAAIGLSRAEVEDAQKSIYFTNVLNWRPPGNRSPLPAEIELSVLFIRKHIELIKPKALYLMGSVAAKAVLGSDLTIGKLRAKEHVVQWEGFECPAMVSYHPSFLLRSPLKKREAWDDLLLLKERFLQ